MNRGCAAIFGVLILSILPAWITHIVVTIKAEEWLFLIAGAIMPPIGIIHGWGIWFGVW